MEYVENAELAYILNKYHDAKKPFDGFHRFIRRDGLFDADSGMEAEALYEAVIENDRRLTGESHPIRKARALAMLLENTRLSCDARDRFPAVNVLDRPIKRCLVKRWRAEVFGELLPETERRRAQLEQDGAATILPDFDHSTPFWGSLLRFGFSGLIRECETAREKRASAQPLTREKADFYEAVRLAYTAMVTLCTRLRRQAEKTPGAARMARSLAVLERGAPVSMYDALLLIYLYFIVSEHVDCQQVRSLGNLDVMLYPYFLRDRENGISEEEFRRDLACFFLQFTAIGNYWNQPFYLSGTDADGKSLVNPLSYLILDVYDRMGIYNPKIQIKTDPNTPQTFLKKALDMIRRGHNCIVFVSDPTIQRALIRRGASPEEARTCRIHGCYEYSVEGSLSTGMNYVNLLKPLEYCLHGGCDGITGRQCGPAAPAEYESFGDLLTEYRRQLSHLIGTVTETVNTFENYLHVINPQPLLSATFPSCLAGARDVYDGGAVYNDTVMSFGFLADLADSLTQIKRLVFDERRYTLRELTAILDRDFENEETLRLSLLHHPEKYGNDRDVPDGIARDVVSFIVKTVGGRPNAARRGGKWDCGFHVARMSYAQAPLTASSANGRRRGEELSKNISASMGQNREGITAAILTATKLDATAFCEDAALDAGLLPSAVQGEDGLAAMYGLLMAFVKRGGHAIHFNVFDAEKLRQAQLHPEQYGDLQIRVCGWNALFRNISRREQDGFIRQAEALV